MICFFRLDEESVCSKVERVGNTSSVLTPVKNFRATRKNAFPTSVNELSQIPTSKCRSHTFCKWLPLLQICLYIHLIQTQAGSYFMVNTSLTYVCFLSTYEPDDAHPSLPGTWRKKCHKITPFKFCKSPCWGGEERLGSSLALSSLPTDGLEGWMVATFLPPPPLSGLFSPHATLPF